MPAKAGIQSFRKVQEMSKQELIYGLHAVEAVLQQTPWRIKKLLINQRRHDQRLNQIIKLAQDNNIVIEENEGSTLDKLSENANHQGVIVYCVKQRQLEESDLDNLLEELNHDPFILILDGIQDPHNLGACLRSAGAANVDVVIVPKDRAAGMTPTVRKVASGAAEILPFIQVTNLARVMRQLQERGIWLYGADAEAENTLYEIDLKGSVAIVLGAEGKGLRRLTREHCDRLMKIPMQGNIASLNVSVATGICLFEAVRQRKIL